MPTNPRELLLQVFEIGVLLLGVWLIALLAFKPEFRKRWLATNFLPDWSIAVSEFALYFFVLFGGGCILQITLQLLLREFISHAVDKSGLEIVVYGGLGLDGGAIVGWLLYPLLRRAWHFDYGVAVPVNKPPRNTTSWFQDLRYGFGALAISFPLIFGLSAGWIYLLQKFGAKVELQDSIEIFANTKSPFIVSGMVIAICVLAPIMEELLFRAGLYRFCRQSLGRGSALLISGLLFGASHMNLAAFIPLTLFGIILALTYESSGSIRAAIIAHAFFNLNTLLAVLAGLS